MGRLWAALDPLRQSLTVAMLVMACFSIFSHSFHMALLCLPK